MDALDAGADDFDAGEEAAEVTTSPENFTAVCEALEQKATSLFLPMWHRCPPPPPR